MIMKNLILCLSFLFLGSLSKAQCPGCVVDLQCAAFPAAPLLCPAIGPNGQQNSYYDENFTFYMPALFNTQGVDVTLNQITITGITGIPPGLTSQTSASPSNIFYPSQNPPATERGCVKICGTPQLIGNYTIIVAVLAQVSTPFGNISQNNSFTVPITILPPPGGNASFNYNPALGCNPLSVDFDALINSTGFDTVTYAWQFNNGNTSNLVIPPSQIYTVPDTHYVSLTTKIYQYQIKQLSIQAIGSAWCGDVEEPNYPLIGCTASPDLFFQLNNNGSTQASSTIADQLSASWSNLNLVLTSPLFSLDFYDEDLISSNDNLGSNVFNISGAGTYNINTSEIIGTFTVDTMLYQTYLDVDTIIVFETPVAPIITSTAANEFCVGDSLLLNSTNGNGNLQWFLNDTTLIIGANLPNLVVSSTGSYNIIETNNFGCSANSNAIEVTVFTNPSPPSIILNGGIISSSTSINCQWYFNGTIIIGANQPNIAYQDTGLYTLQVVDSNGCSNSSSLYVNTPSGLILNASNNGIRIFPNPTNGLLTVIFENKLVNDFEITVTDLTGNVLIKQIKQPAESKKVVMNLENLAAGAYLIQVVNEDVFFCERVFVLK
jgi:hypothetical protein